MLDGKLGLKLCYLILIILNTLCFIIHIPPSIQVFFHTSLIVYIGSILSIRLYCKSIDTKKEGIEQMTKKDALFFPVIGSVTLGGLFLAFNYLDKDMINIVFHYYFSLIGVFVIAVFFYNRLKDYLYGLSSKTVFYIPKIPYLSDEPTPIDALYFILFVLSSAIGFAYFFTKHYFLNNMYGIFFSFVGIESVMMGSTHIGFILLGLLFFYDIYWVFFTTVMVTVAKSLEGPIKLMFPKKMDWVEQKDFNMIGLGDIVIPGVFVALMLRYDYLRFLSDAKEKGKKLLTDPKGNFIIPFTFRNFSTFLSTFIGYSLGILTTLVIMNVFDHAQPALLYLVPGVLIGASIPAFLRRGFKDYFEFDESKVLVKVGLREPEETEEKKDKIDDKNKDTNEKNKEK